MNYSVRIKAWILLTVFASELFSPIKLVALTSGPTQPEQSSFTPASTTEMVDPFTGDFNYNISLLDVEGYPVNIAYSSGVGMEQEASWVGLGWNLNVGSVNRTVRGVPDDFNGDKIITTTSIKEMKNYSFGASGGVEVAGFGGDVGYGFQYNNYKGFGLNFSPSLSAPVMLGLFKASVGFNLSTLDGTSFNGTISSRMSSVIGASASKGYDSRSGQASMNLSASISVPVKGDNTKNGKSTGGTLTASGGISYLPIGMQTYTPSPSLKFKTTSISFSGSVGGELQGVYANGKVHGMLSKQYLADSEESTKTYGVIYHENASADALLDFNRDKNIALNETTNNLSATALTYDVYSVTGHGAAGSFRPFRNEVTRVSDPYYEVNNDSENSFGAEVGLGSLVRGGFDLNKVKSKSIYGAWNTHVTTALKQAKPIGGSIYENVYFKSAGERTVSDLALFNSIKGYNPVAFIVGDNVLVDKVFSGNGYSSTPEVLRPKYKETRSPRSNLFYTLTVKDCKALNSIKPKSYIGYFFQDASNSKQLQISEIDRGTKQKSHHIAEVRQINTMGESFIYGTPAYNFVKKEVSFAMDHNASNLAGSSNNNLKQYNESTDASTGNNKGKDNFFNMVQTPPYVHTYLLTSKWSPDYQDITGDGLSADDNGNGYQFNYTKTSNKYKWRSPYEGASYSKGFEHDTQDQKGSYTYGEKELWYVHSIESKNQVAEFYISPRTDAIGVKDEEGGNPKSSITGDDRTYRLDSISLYNKYDRLKNKEEAIPVKRVHFEYDYSLCQGIPNSSTGSGKLTLLSIKILNGKSNRGGLSPYEFEYSNNYIYSNENMDRWGNYKDQADNLLDNSQNPTPLRNSEFPYVLQDEFSGHKDDWASAWALSEIALPSGGLINIKYEADDYAYVQDREAMQMYQIVGAGSSNTFINSDNLYNNRFLYFSIPVMYQTIEESELKGLLFGENQQLENMYFKFKVNIDGDKYEEVSGYVKAKNIGKCYGNNQYGYIELEQSSPNIISRTAWGFFRENLFDVLYKQPNVSNGPIESVIKGLVANVGDIRGMLFGVESLLQTRGVAKKFKLKESFVRLNSISKKKIGGGSRVKEVKLNDQWATLTGEGENSNYGQNYFYTTTHDKYGEISSGVAVYEPMIGAEENPFREPDPYIAVATKGHVPAIAAYNEYPIGESLFPGASVGYSKITVKDVNQSNSLSASTITEKQFYTAKDFPVRVLATESQKLSKPASPSKMSFPFKNVTQESRFTASQGFTIILNDMHGKLKKEETYSESIESIGITNIVTKKVIGGTINHYKTKNESGKIILDNVVETWMPDNTIKPTLLGVESELVIDTRMSDEATEATNTSANVDIIILPIVIPITFPIPSPNHNTITQIEKVNTITSTKVIQEYGILEKVTSYTDQYQIEVENALYDGETGEVILTKSVDEYNKDEYIFNMPAYKMDGLARMGGAYENIGLIDLISKGSSNTSFKSNKALKHGDQVIISDDQGFSEVAWVEYPLDCIDGFKKNPCPSDIITLDLDCGDCNFCADGVGCGDEPSSNVLFSELIEPTIVGNHVSFNRQDFNKRMDSIREGALSFQIFHLKDKYADQINMEIASGLWDPYNSSNNSNHIFYFSSNICQMMYSGDPYTSTIRNSPFSGFYKITDDIHDLFDFTDTIRSTNPGDFEFLPASFKNNALLDCGDFEWAYDFNKTKYFKAGQPLIYCYYSKYKGDTLSFYSPKLLMRDALFPSAEPYIKNIGCNSGEFRLIKRDGIPLEDMGGKTLKVIRSGNKNLQALSARNTKSIKSPINIDIDQKFLGLAPFSSNFDYLSVTGQEYGEAPSDKINSVYQKSGNPFIDGQYGVFRVLEEKTIIAPRNSDNFQTSSAGIYANTGEIDVIQYSGDPCDPLLLYPELSENVSYGWFPKSINELFSSHGQVVQSKNTLEQYSSAQVNSQGAAEAVVFNSAYKQMGFESFENYYQLGGNESFGGNVPDRQFKLLGMSLNIIYDSPHREIREIIPTSILVKGEAHTGDYSLFLKHEARGPFSLDVTEREALPLANYTYSNTINNNQILIANQGNEVALNYDDFKEETGIDLLNYSSTSTLDIDLSAMEIKGLELEDDSIYIFSLWVRDIVRSGVSYYGNAGVRDESSISQVPKGEAIDGWRKLEFEFTYNSEEPTFTLFGGDFGALFDDIRIFPKNANMKSFVYDRLNNRLTAELDENNFATFYEYDHEGNLFQVKKETLSGIITISESRKSINKK